METKAIKGQEVTITVTPAEGYLIAKSDIDVIAVKDPASATRGDGSIPIGSALVLTLSGKGTAGTVNTKGGSEEMPWSQFSAGITELVIEGDIEALGDGVLKDLTALTAIIDVSRLIDSPSATAKSGWYDLSGRRLNAAPTRSGLYIYNGKIVAKPCPSTPF